MAPRLSQRELATQFEKLCKKLPGAIKKSGTISILDDILNGVKGAVRKYRTSKELIPAKYISDLVPLLDTDDYDTCSRLSAKVFVTVVEAILQTESCLQGERGIYLLGAGLYYATQQQSQGRSIKANKIEIGKDCMHALVVYFTNVNKSASVRKWVGILILQLLEDCDTNAEKLTKGSADAIRLLGKFVVEEVNELVRLVFAEVVKAMLSIGVPREDLWPSDMDSKAYKGFPDGSHAGLRWHKQFEEYMDELVDTQTIEVPDPVGELFFCQAVGTGPEDSIGTPGLNLSVFLDGEKLSILAPVSSTEFYTSLEIPLDLVASYHIHNETIFTSSQTPNEFADIVLVLERSGREQFCTMNSANMELEKVHLAFSAALVEVVASGLATAISKLNLIVPETDLSQNLGVKEPGSFSLKASWASLGETDSDDSIENEDNEKISGAENWDDMTREVKASHTGLGTKFNGSRGAADHERREQYVAKAVKASEASLDDSIDSPNTGNNEQFKAEGLQDATVQRSKGNALQTPGTGLAPRIQPVRFVDNAEGGNEDELQNVTPLIQTSKGPSKGLARGGTLEPAAMGSRERLALHFREPSRVGPIPKPTSDKVRPKAKSPVGEASQVATESQLYEVLEYEEPEGLPTTEQTSSDREKPINASDTDLLTRPSKHIASNSKDFLAKLKTEACKRSSMASNKASLPDTQRDIMSQKGTKKASNPTPKEKGFASKLLDDIEDSSQPSSVPETHKNQAKASSSTSSTKLRDTTLSSHPREAEQAYEWEFETDTETLDIPSRYSDGVFGDSPAPPTKPNRKGKQPAKSILKVVRSKRVSFVSSNPKKADLQDNHRESQASDADREKEKAKDSNKATATKVKPKQYGLKSKAPLLIRRPGTQSQTRKNQANLETPDLDLSQDDFEPKKSNTKATNNIRKPQPKGWVGESKTQKSTNSQEASMEKGIFDFPEDDSDVKFNKPDIKSTKASKSQSKGKTSEKKVQKSIKLQKTGAKSQKSVPSALKQEELCASQRTGQRVSPKKAKIHKADDIQDDSGMPSEVADKGRAEVLTKQTLRGKYTASLLKVKASTSYTANGDSVLEGENDNDIGSHQQRGGHDIDLSTNDVLFMEDLAGPPDNRNASSKAPGSKIKNVYTKSEKSIKEDPTLVAAKVGLKMAERLGGILDFEDAGREEHLLSLPQFKLNESDGIQKSQFFQRSKLEDELSSEPRLSKPQSKLTNPEQLSPEHKLPKIQSKQTKPEPLSKPWHTNPSVSKSYFSPSSQNLELEEEDKFLGMRKSATQQQEKNCKILREAATEGVTKDAEMLGLGMLAADLPKKVYEKESNIVNEVLQQHLIPANKETSGAISNQAASAKSKATANPLNKISKSKQAGGKVPSPQTIEYENENFDPVPETPSGGIQRSQVLMHDQLKHASLNNENITSGNDNKRKAHGVNTTPLKRRRLSADTKGQASSPRRSPRLKVKSQAEQNKAFQESNKNAQGQESQQTSVKPSPRRSPRLEARAMQAAAALNKVLSENTPLVDDDIVRKPQVITFGAKGPRNQGMSSVLKSSGVRKNKDKHISRELAPQGDEEGENRRTEPNEDRDTVDDNDVGVDELALTIKNANVVKPVAETTYSNLKRKRVKGNLNEDNLDITSPSKKRRSISPPLVIEVTGNENMPPQPSSHIQAAPLGPRRQQSFRLGSQSSRVDLNGSPIGPVRTSQVDHISKLKKKLQSDIQADNDQLGYTQVDGKSNFTRATSVESDTMFGPRVILPSITKPKPVSPEKEVIRYVPHKKNMRTGAYEEIGSKEVVAPEEALADPFVDKPHLRSSNFIQRLQAKVEPEKHKIDKEKARIMQAVTRIFDEASEEIVTSVTQVQPQELTTKTCHAENKPDILKALNQVFDDEDEVTLVGVGNARVHKVSSPIEMTSGSSNTSPEGASRSPLTEAIADEVWNMAVRPHYRNYHAALHRVADELITKLESKEFAIDACINDYRVNGTKLLDAFDEQRQAEQAKILQEHESKKIHLVKVFREAKEYVARSEDGMERLPLVAYEKEWQQRQDEIEKSIGHARQSLGF